MQSFQAFLKYIRKVRIIEISKNNYHTLFGLKLILYSFYKAADKSYQRYN